MAANLLLVDVRTPHPDAAVQSKAEAALERVKKVVIVDSASYRMAAADLAAIKGQFKSTDAQREELKAPSLEGCRRVDAFFRDPLDFLRSAEAVLKSKLDAWDKEQKRLAAVEQARLDEIARREREKREAEAREAQRKAETKAAEERRAAEEKRRAQEVERRKAQEAEMARLKAERDAAEARARGDREARERAEQAEKEARAQAAAAERAARDAEAAAAKLEARAESTEQRGVERAEILQQQARSVVAPVVQVEVPKVAGLSSRKNYKAKVTNLMALVRAVAEGTAPLAYVMANEATLNKMAKALQEQICIPGVELVQDTIKSSRALESQS
jgi:chromosome segregation ATPase